MPPRPPLWVTTASLWTDCRRGDDEADIYGYDLATGEVRLICAAPPGSRLLPDISGSWVVWTDYRRGADGPDIHGHDLDTGEERAVCRDPRDQTNPLLSAG